MLTPEQHLEIERKAEYKSEYYAGEMFPRARSSQAEAVIAVHALALPGEQFRGRPYCVLGMTCA